MDKLKSRLAASIRDEPIPLAKSLVSDTASALSHLLRSTGLDELNKSDVEFLVSGISPVHRHHSSDTPELLGHNMKSHNTILNDPQINEMVSKFSKIKTPKEALKLLEPLQNMVTATLDIGISRRAVRLALTATENNGEGHKILDNLAVYAVHDKNPFEHTKSLLNVLEEPTLIQQPEAVKLLLDVIVYAIPSPSPWSEQIHRLELANIQGLQSKM